MALDLDLRARNIDAIFAIFDADADDFITSDDMMAIAARACEQMHIVGSPVAAAIMEIHASWWEQLRADCDTDGDGRISRAEFAQAMPSGGGDLRAYFGGHMAKLTDVLADAMDADGDGFIEQDEYLALLRTAPGVDLQAVLSAFARIDADGDGRISREEFHASATHIFLSSDPAHHGTDIFGHA